jgi:hypothetical protein
MALIGHDEAFSVSAEGVLLRWLEAETFRFMDGTSFC